MMCTSLPGTPGILQLERVVDHLFPGVGRELVLGGDDHDVGGAVLGAVAAHHAPSDVDLGPLDLGGLAFLSLEVIDLDELDAAGRAHPACRCRSRCTCRMISPGRPRNTSGRTIFSHGYRTVWGRLMVPDELFDRQHMGLQDPSGAA